MPELQSVQKKLKEEVVKEALKSSEECGEAALKEFAEKYEESILAAYVDEKNNYIVDGAIIRCDQMSDKDVYISYEEGKKILYGEGGRAEELDPDVKKEIFEYFFKANSENEEVRRLSAVHATEQADNGIPFATVSDCTCLREVEDCKKRGRKPASQASIVSLGNCKIMKSSDIREIEKRADKAREYGTCYCLIQPALEWVNPYCIEGLEGNCDGETETDEDITSYIARVPRQVCNDDSHHNTMKWSTKEGQKEGLTLLSTLLCKRGGRITIEVSGQSIVGFNLEEEVPDGVLPEVSKKAIMALMELETLNNYADTEKECLVIENGKLIGIKPHLAGDGGITAGFGDYLDKKDLKFYEKYGYKLSTDEKDFDKIKDIVVPTKICYEKMKIDIAPLRESLQRQVNSGELRMLSQQELDALIIAKYQCYNLEQEIWPIINENQGWDALYEYVLKKHGENGGFESRTEVEMNIFFEGNYEVDGGLGDTVRVEVWESEE